jgi:hypothetical protein
MLKYKNSKKPTGIIPIINEPFMIGFRHQQKKDFYLSAKKSPTTFGYTSTSA